eukprot:scaffold11144_cov111-Isochrysis_galbana.AAC.9
MRALRCPGDPRMLAPCMPLAHAQPSDTRETCAGAGFVAIARVQTFVNLLQLEQCCQLAAGAIYLTARRALAAGARGGADNGAPTSSWGPSLACASRVVPPPLPPRASRASLSFSGRESPARLRRGPATPSRSLRLRRRSPRPLHRRRPRPPPPQLPPRLPPAAPLWPIATLPVACAVSRPRPPAPTPQGPHHPRLCTCGPQEADK